MGFKPVCIVVAMFFFHTVPFVRISMDTVPFVVERSAHFINQQIVTSYPGENPTSCEDYPRQINGVNHGTLFDKLKA